MDSNKVLETREMLHQMVVDFSLKEIKPFNEYIEKNKKVPSKLWNKIIDTGFLGLILPIEHGGANFDPLSEANTIFDVASVNASLAFTLEGHFKTVNQLMKYGKESLKKKYLPIANKKIFGFESTEPSGGSNVL